MIMVKKKNGDSDVAIWEWLKTLLKTLGDEGMSSDDSDIDDRTQTEILHVRKLPWRRSLDKELDIIDSQRRDDQELFTKKGSKPVTRLRHMKELTSRRNAPTEKPKNIFEKSWLKKQQDQDKLELKGRMVWIDI
jgi:hypothetical protein